MKIDEAVVRIEEMIALFAKEAENDEDYLEMLSEMSERATNAYNARMEDFNEGEGNKTGSGT